MTSKMMLPFFWAKLTKNYGYVEIDGKLAKFTFSSVNVTPEVREQKILFFREEIRKMEEKEHKLERERDYENAPTKVGLIDPENFTDPATLLASKQSLKILEQGDPIILATIVPVEDLDITNITTMARDFEKSKKANATKLAFYRQLLEDDVRLPASMEDAHSNEERQLFMLHQIYGSLPPEIIKDAKTPDERFLELEGLLRPVGLPRLQKDCTGPYAELKLEYVRLYQRICKRKGGMKAFRADVKAKQAAQTAQQQPAHTVPVPIPQVVYPDPPRSDVGVVTLTIGH